MHSLGLVHMESKKCPYPTNMSQNLAQNPLFWFIFVDPGTFFDPMCTRPKEFVPLSKRVTYLCPFLTICTCPKSQIWSGFFWTHFKFSWGKDLIYYTCWAQYFPLFPLDFNYLGHIFEFQLFRFLRALVVPSKEDHRQVMGVDNIPWEINVWTTRKKRYGLGHFSLSQICP